MRSGDVLDDRLFLNYKGEGITDRGVKKIVEKYRVAAGITKQVSCYSPRHTALSRLSRRLGLEFHIDITATALEVTV